MSDSLPYVSPSLVGNETIACRFVCSSRGRLYSHNPAQWWKLTSIWISGNMTVVSMDPELLLRISDWAGRSGSSPRNVGAALTQRLSALCGLCRQMFTCFQIWHMWKKAPLLVWSLTSNRRGNMFWKWSKPSWQKLSTTNKSGSCSRAMYVS